MERRYVPVAEIARPHGVQGELRLRVFNEGSDLLLGKPPVRLRLTDGSERDAKLTSARRVNKALLVRLVGIDERDAAEALRGATLCVPRDAFAPLAAGEFYACDLEGAHVVMASGDVVGRVEGLESYPTCDVLIVAREGGGPIEVPLTESYIASIDVERQVVLLVTLEGLV